MWCVKLISDSHIYTYMELNYFVVASVLLLALSEVLIVVSLFSSDWLISDYVGQLRLGLSISCHSSPNVNPLCTFGVLHSTWSASVIIMIGAISSLTISMALLVVSLKKRHASLASAGKWAAFAGTVLLCIVGVIFPIGFSATEVGGSAYRLPQTFTVGYSYAIFNIAIIINLAALFVANKFFVANLIRTNR